MRRRSSAIVATTLAGLAACSSFGSSDDRPAAGDGGAAMSPEASTDGGGADAAGAGPYCESLSPQPTLCWDFDDGEIVSAGWTAVNAEPPDAGTFAVDESASVSPPAAIVVTLPASTSSSTGPRTNAARRLEIVGPASSIRVGFDIRVDSADADFISRLVTLTMNEDKPVGRPYSISLGASLALTRIIEDFTSDGGVDEYIRTTLTRSLKRGIWSRVELQADFAKRLLTVVIDGAPALVAPKAMEPGAEDTGPIRLIVGAANYGDGDSVAEVSVRYDNIVLDVR